MNPDNWARVSQIFDRVADRPRSERGALLDELCEGDAALRREVETLLDASVEAATFLEAPYTDGSGEMAAEPPPGESRRVGPYVLDREIGRGGMGVVYLAHREDFPKAVALKLVRASGDPAFLLRRFRRERDILAGLEHPGIARLYDAGTAEDGTPYFAMEHVEGLSILEWADARRLSTSARVSLLLDVCAGVEYAHQHQVLHRDLKPSNILVTEDGAPKLLDFGVAKLLEPAAPGETEELTLTAAPLMTPEYASPEQVRGEPLGPASDVYSLGVVLYQLLTGRRPYRLASRSPREIERAVCETDPPRPSAAVITRETEPLDREDRETTAETTSPSVLREGSPDKLRRRLRGDLDAIVLKALRKDPAARYADVAALADDPRRHLAGYPVTARRGGWRYRAGKFMRRHQAAAAALGLAAVALVAGLLLARLGVDRPPAGAAAGARRTVAILPFKNLSADPERDWISPTLGEMLRTELAAGGGLRVVSGDQVAQALHDLRLPASDAFGQETVARLRRKTGSDLVVLGSYLASPSASGPLRVDVRVEDCRTGQMVGEVTETGTADGILDLVARAGFGLRSRLDLTLSSQDAATLQTWRPTSPVAARAYAEGVAYQRRFDYQRARPLLEQAIAAEPGFAPAHLELALLLAVQGYQRQAEESARTALRLAPPTPGKARLEVEARVRFVLQDWDGAARAYRALRALDPENLEWGLELSRAQHAAGKVPDALATLAELRALPPPARDDPRIDLQEARISTDAAQIDRALAAALAKGEALGATLVIAQTRWVEGVSAASRGDHSRDVAAMEEARRLFAEGGDRVSQARATAMLGFTRFGNGDPQGGAKLLRGALDTPLMSDLPAARRYAETLLGFVEEGHAELRPARDAFGEARRLSRELGSTIEPVQEARVALLDFLLGRRADSRVALERAREEVATHPTWVSEVNQLLVVVEIETDPAAAARLAGESMAADRAAGSELTALVFQRLLGYARLQQGEVEGARSSLEEAAAALEKRGQTWEAIQTRMAYAEAALAHGDLQHAEAAARAAAETGRRWSPLSLRLPSASTVLSRVLLEEGKLAEAAAALQPVREAAQRSTSPLHRLAVDVDAARLRAARGETKTALADLQTIADEASRLGYRLTAFRARLAHDRLLLTADSDAGAGGLRALAAEARRDGFEWIADQAESALAATARPVRAG